MKYNFSVLMFFLALAVNITASEKKDMSNIYNYKILKAGEIKPRGWIYTQLSNDLTQGYVGRYNKVHKTVNHNVFVEQNRLSKRTMSFRKEWWSGEHEGYWKDAVIRAAYLTGNDTFINLSKNWIEELIANTDEHGYIGIYKDCNLPGCRFTHVRGNGELWVTSRILMAMLAYYEYTLNEQTLETIEKAVRLVIDKYSNQNYFNNYTKGGGVGHGVGFFEVLEWLYRITNNEKYLEFADKLYQDFNSGEFRDDDLKTQLLLNKDKLFVKHGAHIAEGLFVPEFIASVRNDDVFTRAAKNVLVKLNKHLTPGGAMRCDEWVKERTGNADERYEYCGIAEMVSPLNKIIAFSGDISQADKIETMTFNAGQGARFPVLNGLSYLTTDNRLKINHRELILRETYDAAHFAAACCALNGGRLMPYYVEGMWMKKPKNDGVLALLFGPCELNTSINQTAVNIKENTSYPFDNNIEFTINPAEPVKFPLEIRKPFGCEKFKYKVPENAKMVEHPDRLTIYHQWEKGDKVNVTFLFEVKKITQPASKTVKDTGVYFKRGPLVYALPYHHKTKKSKEYNNSGFYRYKVTPKNKKDFNLQYLKNSPVNFIRLNDTAKTDLPWAQNSVRLNLQLQDKRGKQNNYELVPMGSTVLRRVTFSVVNNH